VSLFRGLGPALRLLRHQRGKSQKQVAAAAGVTPPMLSAYENERTCPEMETLDKVLDRGLEASLEDLTWALDVVNDRLPRHAAPPAESPARRDPTRTAVDPRLLAILASGGDALPPALEEGYSEIVQGLLKISRFVFESVSRPPEERRAD
jgi:transcriptional regulator with XRE-family HTH domain